MKYVYVYHYYYLPSRKHTLLHFVGKTYYFIKLEICFGHFLYTTKFGQLHLTSATTSILHVLEYDLEPGFSFLIYIDILSYVKVLECTNISE